MAAADDTKPDNKAGWIAALNVRNPAVIAATGAALIGVVSSLLTAHVTSRDQAATALSEFLREQRQAAYAKLLTDAATYDETVNHCTDLRTSTPNQTYFYRTLYADIESVELVANAKGASDSRSYALQISHLGAICNRLSMVGRHREQDGSGIAQMIKIYQQVKKVEGQMETQLLADGRDEVSSH